MTATPSETVWACARCQGVFRISGDEGEATCPYCRHTQTCRKCGKEISAQGWNTGVDEIESLRVSSGSATEWASRLEQSDTGRVTANSVKTIVILGISAVVMLGGAATLYLTSPADAGSDRAIVEGEFNLPDRGSDGVAITSEEKERLVEREGLENEAKRAVLELLETLNRADSGQDALHCFFDPAESEALLLKWQEQGGGKLSGFRPETLKFQSREGDIFKFSVATTGGKTRVLIAGKAGNAWKLDLSRILTVSEMSAEKFLTSKPRNSIAVYCTVRPSNYYNYGFSDMSVAGGNVENKKWQCYELVLPDGVKLYGYAEVDAPEDLAIKKYLGMGAGEYVLGLRFPAQGGGQGQAIIDRMVAPSWLGKSARKLSGLAE